MQARPLTSDWHITQIVPTRLCKFNPAILTCCVDYYYDCYSVLIWLAVLVCPDLAQLLFLVCIPGSHQAACKFIQHVATVRVQVLCWTST